MFSLKKIVPASLLGSALLLAACATTQVERVPVTFSMLTTTAKSVLECDPKKPSLNISVSLYYVPTAENPAVAAQINHEILEAALSPQNEVRKVAATSEFSGEVDRYLAEEIKKYQETWTEIYKDWGHSSGAENRTTIDGSLRYADASRLVYAIAVTEDFGGAHPMHWEKFLNLDATSGKRLMLADLLKPGYEAALEKILTKKAMELEKVKTEQELASEPRVTENFILEDDGIVFYFNPYDIAAYAQGAIVLKVSYAELREWLLPEAARYGVR